MVREKQARGGRAGGWARENVVFFFSRLLCVRPVTASAVPAAGMLTNLGKLPINRIHNTLKMFMSSGDNKYDKTIQELGQLLWRLCTEGKLEQVDGEYRLVKD